MTHHDVFNDLVLLSLLHSSTPFAFIHKDGLSTDGEIRIVHTAMCQIVMHSSRR